ncbi:FAD-dependent monooxygenase [Litoribrevibacter euphylliae]|uniref:FAD-dependent monooxygenase n=1 Tax=Litoribrevibacter euphylliae TaxID=1834034 RepID=A0ABV7HM95_9GAMM
MDTVSQRFDVVIVGGGLVGATLALLLSSLSKDTESRRSLSIGLIEAGPFNTELMSLEIGDTQFDPRVVALTHASENLFQRIGVWPLVEELRSCAYRTMSVWDAEGTGGIEFSSDEANVDHLGTVVENRILTSALRHCIAQCPNIKVLDRTAVSQLGPMVEDDAETTAGLKPHGVRLLGLDNGQVISARVVVAADGAMSAIRHLAAFNVREWSYNHNAIVTTVETELSHGATARQAFAKEGPLAFLPLSSVGGRHFCSIVWSQEPERAQQLMALSDGAFCHEISNALEHRLGTVLWVDRRYSIPLKQRHAVHYVKDRIALVGDAAHTIHPLAGQGVNLGLLDVAVLAEELVSAFEKNLDLGSDPILRRYQRRRMGHNLSMMSVMEGFKQLFAESAPPVRFIRNVGMSLLNQHPLIKRPIIMRAMGLDGDLPDSVRPLF